MKRIVVGNWKQNMTLAEIETWTAEFVSLISTSPANNVDIIVAAPYPYLGKVAELCAAIPNFSVAAQDVSEFEDGRHTGKVSATQLKDFVKYCIVGHSEAGDSQEVAEKKAKLCLDAGITPIFCFVDTENVPQVDGAVLVWEDPANISTGEANYRAKATGAVAMGVAAVGKPVLYGGSVNGQNASELSKIDGLAGVLPGNASLEAKHFFEIVSAFA